MWNLKAMGCARGMILAGVVMGVCGRGFGVTINSVWDGSSGNNWGDAAHWAPGVVPDATGQGLGTQYVVSVNGGLVNLNVSPLITGLTVGTGAEVDATAGMNLGMGTLTNNGKMQMNGLSVSGAATNSGYLGTGNGGNVTMGSFTNTGLVQTNVTGAGNVTFAVAGLLATGGGDGFEVDTGTTATAGSLSLTGSGSLVVQVGASLVVTGGGSGNGALMTDVPAGATLGVHGTFWVQQTTNGNVTLVNGMQNITTVEGALVLGMANEYTSMGNVTVSSTGVLVMLNGTLTEMNVLTNGGIVATNFFGTAATTFDLNTLVNQVGGQFTINATDHFNCNVVNNSGTVTVQANNQTFLELDGGNGTVVLQAAQLNLVGGTSTNLITDNGAGDTVVVQTLQTGAIRVGTLYVQVGSHFTINAPGKASKVNTLTLATFQGNTGAVQLLFGSPLVVEGAGSAHLGLVATLRADVLLGKSQAAGIYDSSLTSGQRMVVSDFGVVDASLPAVTTYEGVSVDAGSVVVVPTWLGDANLDGVVDIKDLQVLANHWQKVSIDWRQADFDGNGTVDILDLQSIANHWQAGIGSGGGSGESFGEALGLVGQFGGTQSVPEAGTVGVLAVGAMGLMRRRRGIA